MEEPTNINDEKNNSADDFIDPTNPMQIASESFTSATATVPMIEATVSPPDLSSNLRTTTSDTAAACAIENHKTEAEKLDDEIEILRRRYEILRLRKEIETMERSTDTIVPQRVVNFQEIEHAIIKFSGEDRSFGITEFFQNLEEVLEHVKADELLKFLTLRNSLTGSARLLLGRGAMTYAKLFKGKTI